MPRIKGRKMSKGFMSPAPGKHSSAYADVLAKVYGSCRERNAEDTRSNKAMCARIAHSQAKKTVGF